MNGDSHDDRPPNLAGIDPQAATDELRAILAASGEGQGIVAQCRALIRWAEKNGRSISQGLVPATPLEYLVRWANHNTLFPPITRISGLLEAIRHGLAILIEQEALLGDLPSLGDVEEFMHSAGYAPLAPHPFAWKNKQTGFALFDARPANFVQVSGVPIPFDLIVVPLENLH
jgi:hypothetical protein